MSVEAWLSYAIATLLICITPGPNMMLMLAMGLQHGLRGTVPAMLGALSVVLAMLVASALGLGFLLQQSPAAFVVLRSLGAAYLAWLGVQLLLQPAQSGAMPLQQASTSAAAGFIDKAGRAMAVAGSNPKAIVFAAAWFPQFVDAGRAAWPQLAVLLPTFVVLELACYILYALSGQGLAKWFARPGVLRIFNGAIGIIFIAFGILLAAG